MRALVFAVLMVALVPAAAVAQSGEGTLLIGGGLATGGFESKAGGTSADVDVDLGPQLGLSFTTPGEGGFIIGGLHYSPMRGSDDIWGSKKFGHLVPFLGVGLTMGERGGIFFGGNFSFWQMDTDFDVDLKPALGLSGGMIIRQTGGWVGLFLHQARTEWTVEASPQDFEGKFEGLQIYLSAGLAIDFNHHRR